MSFFGPEHFEMLPNKKDREVAADCANATMRSHGKALCGRVLKDGSFVNFTHENKKPTDTHALWAVDITEMNVFETSTDFVKTSEIKEQDRLESQRLYIKQLELENAGLRGKNA